MRGAPGADDMPELVSPMLATPGGVPTGPGWAYEFKWDGVRAVTYLRAGRVRVLSRNDRDVTATYPELAEVALLLGDRQAVLDGEIVALEDGDRPSFSLLQQRMHVQEPTPALLSAVPAVYYVFDVLHLDGDPTRHLPYAQRRDVLAELHLNGGRVRTPAHFPAAGGASMLEAARLAGFEGVIAKRLASTYHPGRRVADWIKTPLARTQEVVIVGYKAGEGRRAGTMGSLLLAVHDPAGVLRYAGHVGTGFTDAALRDLHQRLTALHRPGPPPADVPREHARGAQWVEPVLTGEVAFRTWTPDGRLRHASWRGLRPDRAPAEARRPHPPPPSSDGGIGAPAAKAAAAPAAAARTAAAAPAVPADGRVEGAMRTPDGQWRVEVVRRGTGRWYRIVHGENVIDWLPIESVRRILAEAGVDLGSLVDAEPAA